MHGRLNPHRNLVSIFTGDLLVNLEKVAVVFADGVFPKSPNGVSEIEIHAAPAGADAATFVADFLGCPGSDVAWGQISESGVFALEIIVALRIRNRGRRFPDVLFPLRDPDASIIAQ